MTNLMSRIGGYLIALVFILFFTSAGYYTVQTVPNIRLEYGDQYVNDPGNILAKEAVTKINKLLYDLEETTTIESAVVVINSIREEDPDDFATDLFNYWGIGKPEDNNGLLILLLTDPDERCIIFRTGTGLQKFMPDATCYQIQQDHMIPSMIDGDYSTGMVKGIEATIKQIKKSGYKPAITPNRIDSVIKKESGHPYLRTDLILTGIIIFIFLIYFLSRTGVTCPACKERKLRFISDKREIEPTYTTTGLRVRTHKCDHCGHVQKEEFTLPMRQVVPPPPPRRHTYTNTRTIIVTPPPTRRSSTSSSGSSWSSSSSRSTSSGRSYSGGKTSGSGTTGRSGSTSGGGSRSSFGSSSRSSSSSSGRSFGGGSSSSSGRSFGGGKSSGGGSKGSTSGGGSKSRF